MIYPVEIENNTKSDDPRINNGISDFMLLYVIHKEDETRFILENSKDNGFVDFLVYNKYMKINLLDMEIKVAEYAIINSFVIVCIIISIQLYFIS
jgi:hypothetical protein